MKNNSKKQHKNNQNKEKDNLNNLNEETKETKESNNNNNNNNNNKKNTPNKSNLKKEQFYNNYLSEEEIKSGEIIQKYFIGYLKVIPKQQKYAFISSPYFTNDIVIEDLKDRNRALMGDLVAVELYPQSEWPAKSSINSSSSSNNNNNLNNNIDVNSISLENLNIKDSTQELWRPREDLLIQEELELLQNKNNNNNNNNNNSNNTNSNDTNNNNKMLDIDGYQPKGMVVAILERKQHKGIIGSLNLPSGNSLNNVKSYVNFIPADTRYPNLIVSKFQLPDEFLANPVVMSESTIYLADISLNWLQDSKLPFGENIRSIGQVGDISAETEALLIENGLNHGNYTNEVLEPLMNFLNLHRNIDANDGESEWNIPNEEILKRKDLRSTRRIFTIDPPNARDLDDALHIVPFGISSINGKKLYEVGVHIADVSYFVHPSTLLDNEAKYRATSVYLVQKVIPMLPRILCEQLCSLNPNVDRLAFSVIFILTEDGDLAEGFKPWYGRTIIRSCAKLDYGTAQKMVDGDIPSIPQLSLQNQNQSNNSNNDIINLLTEELWESSRRPIFKHGDENNVSLSCWEVASDVCLLHKVAMSRRKKRLQNGALVLSKSKLTFRLDQSGNPISTQPYPIKESNQLIEEYMLLGNYLVAEKLLETVGSLAFIRNHPPPKSKELDLLVDLVSGLGYDIDTTSSNTLQKSLANISQTNSSNTTLLQIISALLMKPMNRARYIIAGDKTPSKNDSYTGTTLSLRWRHYALSIPYYTHFTSPIRRYADIIVHRLLEEGLKIEERKSNNNNNGDNNNNILSNKSNERLKELVEIANHCNDQKDAAKAAQDRSDIVFLSVFLRNSPQITEGIIVGLGEKSFTVLVLEYSLESRLYVDKVGKRDNEPPISQSQGYGVIGSFNQDEKVLTLTNTLYRPNIPRNGNEIYFSILQLRLMSKVVVRLSANMTPPISVRVDLLGPIET